jgi:hypothetical protein
LEKLFQIAGNPKIIVYILFWFFNVARFCWAKLKKMLQRRIGKRRRWMKRWNWARMIKKKLIIQFKNKKIWKSSSLKVLKITSTHKFIKLIYLKLVKRRWRSWKDVQRFLKNFSTTLNLLRYKIWWLWEIQENIRKYLSKTRYSVHWRLVIYKFIFRETIEHAY